MKEEEIYERLMAYRALDNPARLRAFILIERNPGIHFNELARRVGVERGLLAYHLGVLHAAELVERTLERESKALSKYRLSRRGKRILGELSASARRRTAPR